MDPKQKVTLCPACDACPEVAVYEDGVHIGEASNVVRLKKAEWNQLVEQIQKGVLTKV